MMATNRSYKQKAKIISALLFAYSLSGCAYLYDTFVYQIDVTQGNYIEEDKEAQIHVGMTQEQIVFLLGSPPDSPRPPEAIRGSCCGTTA